MQSLLCSAFEHAIITVFTVNHFSLLLSSQEIPSALLFSEGLSFPTSMEHSSALAQCNHPFNSQSICTGFFLILCYGRIINSPVILILKKNQRKFCYLNRELVSKHHFLTDNYHPTLEIRNLFAKNRFQMINPDEILSNFLV
jgi:hypothetical protein